MPSPSHARLLAPLLGALATGLPALRAEAKAAPVASSASPSPAPAAVAAPAAAPVAAPVAAAAPPLSISSSTHADALVRDFSDGKAGFTPYAVPGGVPSGATPSVVNGALKVVNAHPGSFGMSANMAPFDALKYGTLAFDYKVTPEVKVNIFLRVKGRYHGLTFCGPERVRPGSVKLGAVPDVRADGQWHRAVVPVRALLQKLYPQDESLTIDEIIVGNWDNSGYLVAGFGGNPTGATYWLDNWSFVGARSPEKVAKFQVSGGTGAPMTYALDFEAPKPLVGSALELSPSDGFHVLTVSTAPSAAKNAKSTGSGAGSTASFPFLVAGSAPVAGAPKLANNVIEVPISVSAPLDVRGARATVNGQPFVVSSANPELAAQMQVEPTREGAVLRVRVGASKMKWGNGQVIPIELALKDALGRDVANAKSEIKVDYSQQDAPPPAPRVQFARSGASWDLDGTFERNAGGWVSGGSDGAIIERDSSTSAGGDYSLRLTSPSNAATFRSELSGLPISVEQFPIVSFDYKATPSVRMDFLLSCEGTPYRITWLDSGDRPNPEIGRVPDVKVNGQWQHAEFNLAAMLRAVKPNSKELRLDWFAMSDSGWMGNAHGVQLWIDNFRFVPVEKSPLQAQVLDDDITGIQAIAYSVDNRPDSPVDLSKKVAGDRINAVGNGREYLHLRVQNGAGRWSNTAHFPIFLDANAPTPAAPTAMLPDSASQGRAG